jgi:pimeloyl-ACP methyl ester carboxylesterase
LNAPDPSWWDELAAIQTPLLLIGGGSTSKIPQDKLAEVIARVLAGRLVTLQGAGHSVHRTRPSEFVALVIRCWSTTTVPLTRTYGTPSANRRGSS